MRNKPNLVLEKVFSCSEGLRIGTREVEKLLAHDEYLDAAQQLKQIMVTGGTYLSSLGALSQVRHEVRRLSEVSLGPLFRFPKALPGDKRYEVFLSAGCIRTVRGFSKRTVVCASM